MQPLATAEDRKRIWQMRIINLLHGMGSATIGFNILFLQTKGLDPGAVGIVMGVNALVGALSPPIWGLVADKMRSKHRVFVLTILGTCVASLLVPVTATVRIFGVILATACIPLMNFFRMPSQSVLDTASVSASTVVPGMDYSNVRCWMSIGFTVMSFGYSPLVGIWGADLPFFAFVVFGVLMVVFSRTLKQYDAAEPETQSPGETKKPGLGRLFKNFYLMVFILINVLIMIPLTSSMMVMYLVEEVGADAAMVGIVTGTRVCAEIGMLLLSVRLKRVLSKPAIMTLAAVLFLLEMTVYQFVGSFFALALSVLLGGAGFGLVLSTGFNYVNDLAPEGLKATAIALYTMGLSLAGTLTSFLGGQIVQYQGIRMLYIYGLGSVVLWLILFYGSYFVGEKILKKKAPLPLFRRV